jgi:hypothetical protein
MATANPLAPPSPAAAALSRYQQKTLAPRLPPVPTAEALVGALPQTSRPASRAAALAGGAGAGAATRFAVPPLTAIALDALVRGFEARPSLHGMPASFAAAVALRLPANLDVRLTAPAVHDDNYWRRACEAAGWGGGRVDLARHGGRWKQAFCELYCAQELERLGQYLDAVPVGYEDEFCRPPIDSTHPRWQELYRRVAPKRLDGKPNRERFAASALDEGEIDQRILASPDCGWPYLERLKAVARNAMPNFEGGGYAWAAIDKKAHLAACEAAEAAAAKAAAGEADKKEGEGEGAAGGIATPPSLLAVPYSVAAAKAREDALLAAQRLEDACDCRVEGVALREFVSPDALATWKASSAWPPQAQRGDSVLTARARELQTLLDRVQSCEDHVFRLALREFPSHLDLELVTSRLPNLTALEVCYATKRVGMRVDSASMRTASGMLPADAEAVARCLKAQDSILTSLALPANAVDDGLLALLLQGLLANRTVTHLDLGHNLVTCAGAALLARLLRSGAGNCVLTSLRLADNRIAARGARELGAALRRPDAALAHLDLRLNALTDAGGAALLDGVAEGGALRTLTSLNLSNCALGPLSAAAFARVLAAPGCALVQADLSANAFSDADAAAVGAAVAAAAAAGALRLCALDMRANAQVAPATLAGITKAVYENEVKARGGPSAPLRGAYRATFPADGGYVAPELRR